jgi:DNA gyrase/topoisomerase IV subunit A
MDCNKCFTSNQTLKNHIAKTCPIIQNKKNTSDNKIEALTNTVNELKKELDSLKTSKKVITTNNINNTNCNNVNNNNITNNIQINSFANTEIITEHILNAFLKELSAAAEYAKLPEIEKKKKENAEKNNKLIASSFLEILDNVCHCIGIAFFLGKAFL